MSDRRAKFIGVGGEKKHEELCDFMLERGHYLLFCTVDFGKSVVWHHIYTHI